MRTYRVPIVRTTIENGYIDIEAEDADMAVDEALHMNNWDFEDDAYFEGSCGDETTYEVLYEDGAEDITPASVSDGLWK